MKKKVTRMKLCELTSYEQRLVKAAVREFLADAAAKRICRSLEKKTRPA